MVRSGLPNGVSISAGFLSLILTAVTFAQTEQSFTVPDPFEARAGKPECPVDDSVDREDPDSVLDLMREGPEQAAACAQYLDEHFPDWFQSDEAEFLVEPILGYLLGNGVARGMKRHDDFVNLLGHLQRIAPDWRLRDEVDDILEKAIIESAAQDPFVANFWRSAIEEADLAWRDSEEAKAALPTLYALAVVQQQRTDGLINERPKLLLKELSWPGYAKLILATRVFDTLLKQILIFAGLLLLLVFLVSALRRRKAMSP